MNTSNMNIISRITIRAKLISFSFIVFLMMGFIGFYTYITINKLVQNQATTSEVNEIWVNTLSMRRIEKNFLIDSDRNVRFFESGESQYIDSLNAKIVENDSLLHLRVL